MILTSALLAYGEAPSPHVSPHILLTGLQTGGLDLAAGACELLAVVLYLVGSRRLARRQRRWPASSTASFAAGVLAVWVAIGSGLAAYDDVNFTMHIIQHVLLMMVAAPLIASGRPITLACQAASRANQVRLLRLVRSRPVEALMFPATGATLFYGSMYAYFLTNLYPYSITHQLFHDATHLWFLAVGFVYWQPLVGTDVTRWRFSYPARLVFIMLVGPADLLLGAVMSSMSRPIAPGLTVAATHAGGQTFLFWTLALMGIWVGVLMLRWFHHIARHAESDERKAKLEVARARSRAEALGITDLAPGWTVPAWRLDQLEARRRPLGDGYPPGG